MRRRSRFFVTVIILALFLTTAQQKPIALSQATINPFTVSTTQLQNVAKSLDSRFNRTIGLVYESATKGKDSFTSHHFNQTYWLSNDNTQAAWALQSYYPNDSATINRTVNSYSKNYSLPSSDYIQAFWGMTITLPFHTTDNVVVKNASSFLVVDEIHNGTGNFSTDWQNYENLVVVHALNNYDNNNYTAAVSDFGIAEKMWDGQGIADKAFNASKPVYSDYKLAYLIFLAHVLNITNSNMTSIESTLWSHQFSNGGIAVNYGSGVSGSPGTNSETDASVLMAYDSDLISKIQHPIAGSIKLSESESGAPTGKFALTGCEVSPTSIVGNGSIQSFSAKPDCQVTLTAQPSGSVTRSVFDNGLSNSSYVTCTFGNCGEEDYSYHYQVQKNLSYWISDASGAPTTPTFSGEQFGSPYSQPLSLISNAVWLDFGSPWSVFPETLSWSNSTERWFANSSTLSGTIESSGTMSVEFLHQFFVTMDGSPALSGTTTPASGWFNASSSITAVGASALGFVFSKWSSSTPSITILNMKSQITTLTFKGGGTITAQFIAGVTTKLSVSSGAVARRHSTVTVLTVAGSPQGIKITHGTLPGGVSVKFARTSVTDSISGVTDSITFSASSTVRPGTYHIVISAAGADGQKSSVTYTLTVT